MKLKDLVIKSRSIRAYDETCTLSKEDLLELVDHARFCPTAGNAQALKFYVSWETDEVNAIAEHTHWGKDCPYPGIRCTGFILILQDTAIDDRAWAWWRDAGIAAQTIMLAAAERDLGGLMIGSFDREPLEKLLSLDEHLKILLVLAVGKPAETSVLEEMQEGDSTLPLRDENNVAHVKKRPLQELVLSRKGE